MAPVNKSRPAAHRDGVDAARARRVFVETWGCQMNELDSRRFVGLMSRAGWEESAEAHDADLVLLNTCSVRDRAEQKVYDYLGRVALLKKSRTGNAAGGLRLCRPAGRRRSSAVHRPSTSSLVPEGSSSSCRRPEG